VSQAKWNTFYGRVAIVGQHLAGIWSEQKVSFELCKTLLLGHQKLGHFAR